MAGTRCVRNHWCGQKSASSAFYGHNSTSSTVSIDVDLSLVSSSDDEAPSHPFEAYANESGTPSFAVTQKSGHQPEDSFCQGRVLVTDYSPISPQKEDSFRYYNLMEEAMIRGSFTAICNRRGLCMDVTQETTFQPGRLSFDDEEEEGDPSRASVDYYNLGPIHRYQRKAFSVAKSRPMAASSEYMLDAPVNSPMTTDEAASVAYLPNTTYDDTTGSFNSPATPPKSRRSSTSTDFIPPLTVVPRHKFFETPTFFANSMLLDNQPSESKASSSTSTLPSFGDEQRGFESLNATLGPRPECIGSEFPDGEVIPQPDFRPGRDMSASSLSLTDKVHQWLNTMPDTDTPSVRAAIAETESTRRDLQRRRRRHRAGALPPKTAVHVPPMDTEDPYQLPSPLPETNQPHPNRTIDSDASAFIRKPISSRVPVTREFTPKRRRLLTRNLKRISRHIHRLGERGGLLQTLAVV